MAEDIKATEAEQLAPVEEEVDYDKELEEAAEKVKNDTAAKQRISKHETHIDTDAIAQKVIDTVLPRLQSTAESTILETKLDKLANGNEGLKKLIRHHLENSVNPNMDLDSRLDAAHAIANKKIIEKTSKEINLARQNRSQISNISQGSSQETQVKPGQNVLSEAQLNRLREIAKANKFDEKKFIEDSIKRMTQ